MSKEKQAVVLLRITTLTAAADMNGKQSEGWDAVRLASRRERKPSHIQSTKREKIFMISQSSP